MPLFRKARKSSTETEEMPVVKTMKDYSKRNANQQNEKPITSKLRRCLDIVLSFKKS